MAAVLIRWAIAVVVVSVVTGVLARRSRDTRRRIVALEGRNDALEAGNAALHDANEDLAAQLQGLYDAERIMARAVAASADPSLEIVPEPAPRQRHLRLVGLVPAAWVVERIVRYPAAAAAAAALTVTGAAVPTAVEEATGDQPGALPLLEEPADAGELEAGGGAGWGSGLRLPFRAPATTTTTSSTTTTTTTGPLGTDAGEPPPPASGVEGTAPDTATASSSTTTTSPAPDLPTTTTVTPGPVQPPIAPPGLELSGAPFGWAAAS
jgi:hypothetical protein